MSARLPTYFVSHGGGPWPYMEGDFRRRFERLEASLKAIRKELGAAPRAVLVVTAHWQTPDFAVSTGAWPGMVYDYGGFPEELYRIRYPAPGEPALAGRVADMLQAGGIACQRDAQRGFDHGTFSIMAAMFPDADVPVVQLSVRQDFDPAAHLEAGRLLAPLSEEGVLVIGSGLSYHNLRRLGPAAQAPSQAFDAWLQETLIGSSHDERQRRLVGWESAPAARIAHPSEDHLLPLMVAAGAAGTDAGSLAYHEAGFMGATVSSFRFGALATQSTSA